MNKEYDFVAERELSERVNRVWDAYINLFSKLIDIIHLYKGVQVSSLDSLIESDGYISMDYTYYKADENGYDYIEIPTSWLFYYINDPDHLDHLIEHQKYLDEQDEKKKRYEELKSRFESDKEIKEYLELRKEFEG